MDTVPHSLPLLLDTFSLGASTVPPPLKVTVALTPMLYLLIYRQWSTLTFQPRATEMDQPHALIQQPVGFPPVTVQPQPPGIQQNSSDWTRGPFSCFQDMGECTSQRLSIASLSNTLYPCHTCDSSRDKVAACNCACHTLQLYIYSSLFTSKL